ncbi:MAG: hypothetical protein U5K43_13090 [Halofilum sp. (in: g-proteobacteria)]|nr:hypothetical protein [Halofilum sp. (in: g-proteobacteria)]
MQVPGFYDDVVEPSARRARRLARSRRRRGRLPRPGAGVSASRRRRGRPQPAGAHLVAPHLRRQRHHRRLHRRRRQDGDPDPRQRQGQLPPGAGPGPGTDRRGPGAVPGAAHAARLPLRADDALVRAGHPHPDRLALPAGRASAHWGRCISATPVRIGCGGSIPIAAWARDILGIDTLLMGFSLEDDGMHSPNEKFEVTCFHRGTRTHAALLEELRPK